MEEPKEEEKPPPYISPILLRLDPRNEEKWIEKLCKKVSTTTRDAHSRRL